jgi:hypothetical protein
MPQGKMGLHCIAVPVSLVLCRRVGAPFQYPGTGYSGPCVLAGRACRKGISLETQRELPGMMRVCESRSGKTLHHSLALNQRGRRGRKNMRENDRIRCGTGMPGHSLIAWGIRALGDHRRACDASGVSFPGTDLLDLIGQERFRNGPSRQNRGARSAVVCAAKLRARRGNLDISFRLQPGCRDICAGMRFAASSCCLYQRLPLI